MTDRCKSREDAVWVDNPERWYVPTTAQTRWVASWADFRAAGGLVCFTEDQAGVELRLPSGYKFAIGFMREGE